MQNHLYVYLSSKLFPHKNSGSNPNLKILHLINLFITCRHLFIDLENKTKKFHLKSLNRWLLTIFQAWILQLSSQIMFLLKQLYIYKDLFFAKKTVNSNHLFLCWRSNSFWRKLFKYLMLLWILGWVGTGSRGLMSSSKVQEYFLGLKIDKVADNRTFFKNHHRLFQIIQFHIISSKVFLVQNYHFNFYIFTSLFFANILIKPWLSLDIDNGNLFCIFWDRQNMKLILKFIKFMLFLLKKEKVEKIISSFQLSH